MASAICAEVDSKVDKIIFEESVKDAIKDCKFMVTVSDPRVADCPLIAVSQEFIDMTGYQLEDAIGVNCRFLNDGCYIKPDTLLQMRRCIETGQPFTAVLENRKKCGEPFLNLLDLRGITVARKPSSGEPLWFIVGVQSDLTGLSDGEVPVDHWKELQLVSESIRRNIGSEIAKMAVLGSHKEANNLEDWVLLDEPEWTPVNNDTEGLDEASRKDVADSFKPHPKTESDYPQKKAETPICGMLIGMSICAALLVSLVARRR